MAPLEPPRVPASAYDEAYYREACHGYEEWAASEGAELAPLYAGSLGKAELESGETVVDIGTGRGELLAAAVEAGASRAVGVEYSADAVGLAQRTLAAHGVEERASVIHADARAIPLEDASADLVTLLDVVEHLTPAELARTLGEARRLLRPGGRVLVHTMPNRLVYSVTYRAQRLLHRGWPADPRNHHERLMHVNEQTPRGLRRSLADAGFADVRVELGDWIYTDFVPTERGRVLYHRLAAHRLTGALGRADLWGFAHA